MTMTIPVASCPLCGGAKGRMLETTAMRTVWQHLRSDLGTEFSPGVEQRHSPADQVDLRSCCSCGLQYFAPALAGDAEFYAQLTSSSHTYYTQEKWDFSEALKLIQTGESVLDIACGGGSFLSMAQQRGVSVHGIDTNPAAVARAVRNGLPAECASVDLFASHNRERFDVVTAFQVIEHVPDVLPFVRSALECLKPGGKLIVTVPNRLRRFRAAFEPLDHPPHHLTRWSSDQLIALAGLTDCAASCIRYEPASMHDCRALLRRKVAGERGAQAVWARALARTVFSPTAYTLYAKAGLLDAWGLWRMSVMAVLVKPAVAAARGTR